MKITQRTWTRANRWVPAWPNSRDEAVQLVLVFGATAILHDCTSLADVARHYPRAHILGCSTAGEIHGTQVMDDSLVVTAIAFEHTRVCGTVASLADCQGSFQVGQRLAHALPRSLSEPQPETPAPLVHVFVLSDGLQVNGSDLVRGLAQQLPANVGVTGGLAGDGVRFAESRVVWNGASASGVVAAVGFYGFRLKVGMGSLGGWDPFGPERLITRSKGNVLYELDGQSALALYKKYLGDQANALPASGLLFPLSLRLRNGDTPVVRTILSVDEREQSMTFAGDVPESAYARLMKANFDRLIDGAVGAATTGLDALGSHSPDLAILISCVGRKLVLKQRVEEEVEGVRDVLGEHTALTGFYSYGEISPFTPGAKCELHNQTMTITTFSEI